MPQRLIFIFSVSGFFATVAWMAARYLLRDDGKGIRERLRSADPQAARSGRFDLIEWVRRALSAAATPLMPRSKEKQAVLRRQLGHAGIYDPAALRAMVGLRLVLLIVGLLGGYAVAIVTGKLMLWISVGSLAGYAGPSIWLRMRIRAHQRSIERGLPDALDLLVVCVEAGLTIDAAMQRVGQEIVLAHAGLSKELGLTHMETRVGVPRADALKNLGIRTGNSAVQSLASLLVQSERFGTSVAQALRVQAETLRLDRQNRAETAAAKASVKLSFPVVLFIFPAVLIVLVGPALIGLLQSALFHD